MVSLLFVFDKSQNIAAWWPGPIQKMMGKEKGDGSNAVRKEAPAPLCESIA